MTRQSCPPFPFQGSPDKKFCFKVRFHLRHHLIPHPGPRRFWDVFFAHRMPNNESVRFQERLNLSTVSSLVVRSQSLLFTHSQMANKPIQHKSWKGKSELKMKSRNATTLM